MTNTASSSPPGAAKSAVAKAAGNLSGIPTVALDLSGMKQSLVGQSEQNLRTSLRVISAISGDRVLVIATCNAIAPLPPELRRRFTFGTFFFDWPDAEERPAIWGIYSRAYNVPVEKDGQNMIPPDSGWTGAEIKQCCLLASRLGITLCEAAEYIVPVSRSAAQQIEQLRTQASGRFISASYPGPYNKDRQPATAPAGRAIEKGTL